MEEGLPLTEQAEQHKAPRGPELCPKSLVQKSGAQGWTQILGTLYRRQCAHTYPSCPQGSCPCSSSQVSLPLPSEPREVQLEGPDRASGAPSPRDLPASPRRPTPCAPAPAPVGPPEPSTLHLPAESSGAQIAAQGAEPGGGAAACRAAPARTPRRAPDLPPQRVRVRAASPPGREPAGTSCGPAPLPPRPLPPLEAPTLPFVPLRPQPDSGPPQKTSAAASLFGSWSFFNSQHTRVN